MPGPDGTAASEPSSALTCRGCVAAKLCEVSVELSAGVPFAINSLAIDFDVV